MRPELLDVLRETVKSQLRKEEFEKALGRTVRNKNLEFKDYVEIITELREVANSDGTSLEDAARKLLGQEKK